MQQMFAQLGLSPDQQQQIQTIRANTALSRQDRQAAIIDWHADVILNDFEQPFIQAPADERRTPLDFLRRGMGDKATLAGGTIRDGGDRVVESLLIDFDGDLYGQVLKIECMTYLRPQEKFSSIEELKSAMTRDVSVIREIL